jgi:uncharacterized protein YcbK (DUF882 family)
MHHQSHSLRVLRAAYEKGGSEGLTAACLPISSALLSTAQGALIFRQTEALRQKAKITNFSTAEILYLGATHHSMTHRARGLNTLPPAELLPPLIAIFVEAQKIRTALGSPLLVLSAYRSPRYNTAIGGANNSFHTRCMAIDLAPAQRGRENVARLLDTARTLRTQRRWAGGIGSYPTFIHIDHGRTRDF